MPRCSRTMQKLQTDSGDTLCKAADFAQIETTLIPALLESLARAASFSRASSRLLCNFGRALEVLLHCMCWYPWMMRYGITSFWLSESAVQVAEVPSLSQADRLRTPQA